VHGEGAEALKGSKWSRAIAAIGDTVRRDREDSKVEMVAYMLVTNVMNRSSLP
jgi:hypothetical protein